MTDLQFFPGGQAKDLFLAWFLTLPAGADVAAAARQALLRTEGGGPGDEPLCGFRELLRQATVPAVLPLARRRRLRH